MLYIISFQSISCSEASPTSPRPHAAPQEGVSIGHPLNLPPGFPHVAQLGPLAGLPLNLPLGFPHVARGGSLGRSSPQSSTRFPSRCSALSSGRSLKTILFGSASQSSDQSSHRSSPQSSTRFSTRCSALSSGRSLKTILKPAREAVFATVTQPTGISVPSRRA